MIREPESRFKKGDVVRVVDTPYEDCPFEWIDDMDEYCGTETTITDVFWIERRNMYGYYIAADDRCCTWCENCFVMEPDLEESDSDISVLFE